MRFRPCIDIHDGRVKQIVGSTLKDGVNADLQTNFISERDSADFAAMFQDDGLEGGHIIKLDKSDSTDQAARRALARSGRTLQIGGGVTPENAGAWLDAGAQKVIITSFLFEGGELSRERLQAVAQAVPKQRLVLDLSCRKQSDGYHIACNRWQTICQTRLTKELLLDLGRFCSEFLIHAVDVEGKQSGIDLALVKDLAEWSPITVTYAGGVRAMDDIGQILSVGQGRIDVTVGSALDIFGGKALAYKDLVRFDEEHRG